MAERRTLWQVLKDAGAALVIMFVLVVGWGIIFPLLQLLRMLTRKVLGYEWPPQEEWPPVQPGPERWPEDPDEAFPGREE